MGIKLAMSLEMGRKQLRVLVGVKSTKTQPLDYGGLLHLELR